MKNIIKLFALVFIVSACDIQVDLPFQNDGQKIYTIKKGEHESNRTPKSFDAQSLTFQARFDSSAVYKTLQETNQADINKLMGFSDCNSHHQQNSARFGWRWYDDQLEILAYCYVNGDRISQYVTSVPLGEMAEYKIEIVGDKYVFTVNSTARVEINKNPNCTGGMNYMLFPYFGGDETAPHDITVVVNMDKDS